MTIRNLLNEFDYHRLVTTTPINKKRNLNPFIKLSKDINNGNLNAILIGDSIANGLFRYEEVVKNHLRNFANFGIGGDYTQHVIWRAENMEIPKNIKTVVVQCGTNNIGKSSPINVAKGIM